MARSVGAHQRSLAVSPTSVILVAAFQVWKGPLYIRFLNRQLTVSQVFQVWKGPGIQLRPRPGAMFRADPAPDTPSHTVLRLIRAECASAAQIEAACVLRTPRRQPGLIMVQPINCVCLLQTTHAAVQQPGSVPG